MTAATPSNIPPFVNSNFGGNEEAKMQSYVLQPQHNQTQFVGIGAAQRFEGLTWSPTMHDRNVTKMLSMSDQVVNLDYDHLTNDRNVAAMKKLGMLSGSKQAIENGITTTTEKLLGGGTKTNPNIRLSQKEEEYVISQLMQRNFDKRRGLSVF